MIRVNEPLLTPEDIEAVTNVLGQGFLSGESPPIRAFEDALADLFRRRHAIAVSSGTAALDIMWALSEVAPGDEIIVPSFAIASTIFQAVRQGATLVFVDCDPITWNSSAEYIEPAITSKTKAILAVHTYGLPVDVLTVNKLVAGKNIAVYEDAAEAHGLQVSGLLAGSLSDIAALSFYANKNISSGEGGALLTDSDDLASRARSLRNLSFSKEARFVHHELGWNYRMSAMQAALGLSQLKRLDEVINRRREIADWYHDNLQAEPKIQLPPAQTTSGLNDFWVVGLTLAEELSLSRSEVTAALATYGIETRPFFHPLHLQPFLRKHPTRLTGALENSTRLGSRGFYLPNSLAITKTQVDEICARLTKVLNV